MLFFGFQLHFEMFYRYVEANIFTCRSSQALFETSWAILDVQAGKRSPSEYSKDRLYDLVM